jgi:hypothetical protein
MQQRILILGQQQLHQPKIDIDDELTGLWVGAGFEEAAEEEVQALCDGAVRVGEQFADWGGVEDGVGDEMEKVSEDGGALVV